MIRTVIFFLVFVAFAFARSPFHLHSQTKFNFEEGNSYLVKGGGSHNLLLYPFVPYANFSDPDDPDEFSMFAIDVENKLMYWNFSGGVYIVTRNASYFILPGLGIDCAIAPGNYSSEVMGYTTMRHYATVVNPDWGITRAYSGYSDDVGDCSKPIPSAILQDANTGVIEVLATSQIIFGGFLESVEVMWFDKSTLVKGTPPSSLFNLPAACLPANSPSNYCDDGIAKRRALSIADARGIKPSLLQFIKV